MIDRDAIYESIRLKMEDAGFRFETKQKPRRQHNKEKDLKFRHPMLIKKFKEDGYNASAEKFYIKPILDYPDSEIGLVTGTTSPLANPLIFCKPNDSDSFRGEHAWVNRKDNFALDNLLRSIINYLDEPINLIENNTNTYLFAWNPNKWPWTDLKETIDRLENVGYSESRWSCGNSTSIKKGDRVFLIRLGEEPKGIMGSGYAKSSSFVAPHWDGTKDKTTNYIDIEFDVLINPENSSLFNKEALEKIDPKNVQQWFPRQSGISINPEVVEALESSWLSFIAENKYIGNSFFSNDTMTGKDEIYYEGKSKDIIQTRYERNPHARKKCIDHHGYSCKICDFNFESYFGPVGRGFIHVHHINSIAEIKKEYAIDPKKDLIPVCPNCHAMIHSRRPAFSIEEICEIRKAI